MAGATERRSRADLAAEHHVAAIAARLDGVREHSYLGDAVLGAIDGCVTTFAVVAGVAGAKLPGGIALVLGAANLLADGFSMAVSNFQRARTERQRVEAARRVEESHIDEMPEGEREEVRQIFRRKGLEGAALEHVVEVVTSDRQRWVDTMLTEELGLTLHSPSALRAGLVTFAAFLAVGALPLLPFLAVAHWPGLPVLACSAVATGCAFFAVGWLKGALQGTSRWLSGVETLAIGSAAAALAWLAGVWMRRWAGE